MHNSIVNLAVELNTPWNSAIECVSVDKDHALKISFIRIELSGGEEKIS